MSEAVKQYIPQREPIIMISELVNATEQEANTKLLINDDNIFCKDGKLQEPGIIENIAQTAAAMTGYNALANNEDVKRGFIGGINNLIIHKLPASGKAIDTNVSITNQVMNVTIIKGMVSQDGEQVAECEMKIFLEE